MKKWVSGILLCAAAVSLAACGNKNASSGEGTEKAAEAGESRDSLGGQQEKAANASKVYQIGFTTAAVEDDPYYVFAKNFSDIVAERTGGGIRIDVMGGGQLGQEGEMFSGMQMGTTDMAVMTNAYASGYVPASGLFDLPFIFKDNETAANILDGDCLLYTYPSPRDRG